MCRAPLAIAGGGLARVVAARFWQVMLWRCPPFCPGFCFVPQVTLCVPGLAWKQCGGLQGSGVSFFPPALASNGLPKNDSAAYSLTAVSRRSNVASWRCIGIGDSQPRLARPTSYSCRPWSRCKGAAFNIVGDGSGPRMHPVLCCSPCGRSNVCCASRYVAAPQVHSAARCCFYNAFSWLHLIVSTAHGHRMFGSWRRHNTSANTVRRHGAHRCAVVHFVSVLGAGARAPLASQALCCRGLEACGESSENVRSVNFGLWGCGSLFHWSLQRVTLLSRGRLANAGVCGQKCERQKVSRRIS